MFRTEGTSLRRVLGAPARVTGLGVAVLLVGATLAASQAPTAVHAAAATMVIENGDDITTPSTLATMLLAPGQTLSGTATINGDPAFDADDPRLASYGTFSNGLDDVGIESGLIITANADAASFLTASNIHIIQGVAGDRPDPALRNLLETQPGICTAVSSDECIHNATDLSFSIVPNDNFIKFDYTLLMTETGTFASSAWSGNVILYPDGFGLFVNGESPENNCAAVPSTGDYLTMKTAGIVPPQGSAAANRAAALASVEPNQKFAYATENDQWAVQFLTVPLTCTVDVTDANTNQTPVSVRIVVADVNDDQVPPAVLLEAGSLHFEETSSPVWQDSTLGTMQLGVAYSDGVSASASPTATYSISAGMLPAGLSLNSTTGAITGAPTVAGAYDFTISVANGTPPNLVKQFTGNVVVPPAWTDQTIAAAFQVGVAVNDGVVASGIPAPTYSVSAGTLPAGLSLNTATGAITGTPTAAGAYDFTITAANGGLPNVVQQFTGTVVAAPAWTDQTIAAAFRVGLAVSDGVAASGTPTPTYSVSAGALPAGLSLNTSTGAITGTPTAGGPYNFTLRAVNGIGEAVTKTFTGTVLQPAGGFFAIAPVRLLDTRDAGDSLVGGTVRRLPIAGIAGIPADATSVALNVTATNGTMSGFITVFPCESSVPLASNVNFVGGETVASLVSVSLDSGGGVCLFSNVDTDVVVDISGAYSLSEGVGRLEAAEPYRIADTREGGARLTAGTSYAVDVSGGGAPSDATAMLLNLTVDDPTTAGFVTAYPCGGAVPLASNVNFVAGQTIANSAVVRIGTDHTVCFYVSTDTHLVVDVNGWYSPSSSVGFPTNASPQRLLDTRTIGLPAVGGTVQELDLNGLTSVPANATSVTLNVTVDGPEGSGFVTVYPCSSDRPLASNLNFVAGQTVPNSATVPVGATRAVCVFTTTTTHLVIDLNQVYSTFD